MKNRGLE